MRALPTACGRGRGILERGTGRDLSLRNQAGPPALIPQTGNRAQRGSNAPPLAAPHPREVMDDGILGMAPQDLDGALRLAVAVAVGMAVGLNRDLKGKPTGIRTLGLVCLGAALVGVVSLRVEGIFGHPDATSRVLQGILQGVMTGIGFLGAGVVLVDHAEKRIAGLTTAATVWVTAALGIACALASWTLIVAGVGLALFLLVVAHPLERWLEAKGQRRSTAASSPASTGPAR